MKNFTVITLPGGEQHVNYVGPEINRNSPAQTVRVWGIVTADKIIAAGMAAEILFRKTGKRPTLVIPYFPGARQDRTSDSPNTGFSLHVYAGLIASFDWEKIVVVDPHSTATKVNIAHAAQWSPYPRLYQYIEHQHWFLPWLDKQTFVPGLHKFLFPDKGADTKYGQVAAYSPSRSCTKKRDPATGKLSGFEVPSLRDWEDNYVWIVDDICDGGGTFIQIADRVRAEMGNKLKLGLAVSHGIFSNDANLTRMAELFDYIITTDSVHSHIIPTLLKSKLSVQPLTPILKEFGINA